MKNITTKNFKRLAIAFSGPSNSGKTTLIEKVSSSLQEKGFKVAIIKHDPKDKAWFDTKGKDSSRFFETGADVAVASPTRTTLFKQSSSNLNELIRLFENFDYLLVEGLKTLPLPRISVFRNELDDKYFSVTNAIACDDTIKKDEIPNYIEVLDLNNLENIISWIDKNSKKV